LRTSTGEAMSYRDTEAQRGESAGQAPLRGRGGVFHDEIDDGLWIVEAVRVMADAGLVDDLDDAAELAHCCTSSCA
jgi:hypothetical protein